MRVSSKLKEFMVQRLTEDNQVVGNCRVKAKTWAEARGLAVVFRPLWPQDPFSRDLRCTELRP